MTDNTPRVELGGTFNSQSGHSIIAAAEPLADVCQSCGLRPATLDWVGEGGALAFAHGLYQRWCEDCAVRAQIAHAETVAASLPALRRRLAELAGPARTETR